MGHPHRHGKHRRPEPPHHPDPRHPPPHHPDPPHHPPPHKPEPPRHPPPHKPGHPHEPDHPHRPDHPHKPDHPGRPHHPHRPGPPHRPDGHRRGPKYTSDATFKLPLSDSSLLFYSHGPFAYGGIKFYQDDSDSLKSDEVEVTINAKIWDKVALELAKVCTLKRKHGAGLGIWVGVCICILPMSTHLTATFHRPSPWNMRVLRNARSTSWRWESPSSSRSIRILWKSRNSRPICPSSLTSLRRLTLGSRIWKPRLCSSLSKQRFENFPKLSYDKVDLP